MDLLSMAGDCAMKPGVLVRTRGMSCDLYNDNIIFNMTPGVNVIAGVVFDIDEIGLIIELAEDFKMQNLCKVLTPHGLGWIYPHWLEMVR